MASFFRALWSELSSSTTEVSLDAADDCVDTDGSFSNGDASDVGAAAEHIEGVNSTSAYTPPANADVQPTTVPHEAESSAVREVSLASDFSDVYRQLLATDPEFGAVDAIGTSSTVSSCGMEVSRTAATNPAVASVSRGDEASEGWAHEVQSGRTASTQAAVDNEAGLRCNTYPEFVGARVMKLKLAEQVAKFERWHEHGTWSQFHSSHYDWWTFPIDRHSSYGHAYTVYEGDVAELKKDCAYVTDIRKAASLVCLAWGWDLEGRVELPDAVRGAGQEWSHWPIRLWKMVTCLQLFGLTDEFSSTTSYGANLLASGERFMYGITDISGPFRSCAAAPTSAQPMKPPAALTPAAATARIAISSNTAAANGDAASNGTATSHNGAGRRQARISRWEADESASTLGSPPAQSANSSPAAPANGAPRVERGRSLLSMGGGRSGQIAPPSQPQSTTATIDMAIEPSSRQSRDVRSLHAVQAGGYLADDRYGGLAHVDGAGTSSGLRIPGPRQDANAGGTASSPHVSTQRQSSRAVRPSRYSAADIASDVDTSAAIHLASFREPIGNGLTSNAVYAFSNGTQLHIQKGDIVKTRVDVVVTAANEELRGGGGVDGAIHGAAGPALLRALTLLPGDSHGRRCKAGQAVLTPGPFAPTLASPNVIHAVGPRHFENCADDKLGSAFTASLRLANEAGYRTIALPAISCGVYGFTSSQAAPIALKALGQFCRTSSPISVTAIYIVLFSSEDRDAWVQAATYLQLPPLRSDAAARPQPAASAAARENGDDFNTADPQWEKSYVRKILTANTQLHYKAAGILLCRMGDHGREALFGVLDSSVPGHGQLTALGGQRDYRDKSPVDTALREFDEETGGRMSREARNLLKGLITSDATRAAWLARADRSPKYVLFLVNVDLDPRFSAVASTLPLAFNKWRGSLLARFASADLKEMRQLQWVPMADIWSASGPKLASLPPLSSFTRSVLTRCDPLCKWILKVLAADQAEAARDDGDSTNGLEAQGTDIGSSSSPSADARRSDLQAGGSVPVVSPLASHPIAYNSDTGGGGEAVSQRQTNSMATAAEARATAASLEKARKLEQTAAQREAFRSALLAEVNRRIRGIDDLKKTLQARIQRLTVVTPKPVVTIPPSEFVAAKPGSADFAKYTGLLGGSTPGVKTVTTVKVNSRIQRFHAYLRSLPTGHQQTVTTFHGTIPADNGVSIAKNGFDLTRVANGRALGNGFYTDTLPATPLSYSRGTGAVVVCEAAPGRSAPVGGPGLTAASMQSLGIDSITHGSWRVFFHPDSVNVEAIVAFAPLTNIGPDAEALRKAQETAVSLWEIRDTRRKAALSKAHGQQGAIDYFETKLAHYASMVSAAGDDDEMLTQSAHLFEMECAQFDLGLPMYHHKASVLSALTSDATVIKGGTGIGKTVMVPQWVLDHGSGVGGRGHRVAVLVPRVAIANRQAAYVAKIRGTEVGDEVGVGTGESVSISADTRIIFMTPGYFRAAYMRRNDNFASFSAVVIDEAHEQKLDLEALKPLLRQAVRDRNASGNPFRLVVMSATIDADALAAELTDAGVPSVQQISVPGVTYPVEVEWWQGDAVYDPFSKDATTNLSYEVVKIWAAEDNALQQQKELLQQGSKSKPKQPVMHDGDDGGNNDDSELEGQLMSGNMLVFVPTKGIAEQVASILSSMDSGLLKHDDDVIVLPLHAGLSEAQKLRATAFDDYKEFPAHRGKRMLCIATNIAEAGLTLPGISAVVDTGVETKVVWEPALRTTQIRREYISKASHMQRRGRAGRTGPGRCFNLFSQDIFDKDFPEHPAAEVATANLESFYLGLLAGGVNPLGIPAATNTEAKRRLEAAEHALLRRGAIRTVEPTDPDDNDGAMEFKLTELGVALTELPVNEALAHALLASSDKTLSCSSAMAVIISVAESCTHDPLFAAGDIGKAAKARYRAASGDHETYLAVHNAWLRNKRSASWADSNGINSAVLQAADKVLAKVHRVMANAGIPLLHNRDAEDADEQDEADEDAESDDGEALISSKASLTTRKARGRSVSRASGGSRRTSVCSAGSRSSVGSRGSSRPRVVMKAVTDPSQAILRALCVGLYRHTAVPMNKADLNDGFVSLDGHDTAPKTTFLHRSSALDKSTGGIDAVLYEYRSHDELADRETISGVSVVPIDWIKDAVREIEDIEAADDFVSKLKKIKRESHRINVDPSTIYSGAAIGAAVKIVAADYPTACVRWTGPHCYVAVCCESKDWPAIKQDVDEAVGSCQKASTVISNIPHGALLKLMPNRGVARSTLAQALQTTYSTRVNLEPSDDNGSLKVTATAGVLDDVLNDLLQKLGLPSNSVPKKIAGHGAGSAGGGQLPSTPAHGHGANYHPSFLTGPDRLAAIVSANPADLAKFGRGIAAGYLAVARHVIQQTSWFLYGGFLRDFVVRGEVHGEMDMDIGLPTGISTQMAVQMLSTFAAKVGLAVVSLQQKGPYVTRLLLRAHDGTSIVTLEVVEVQHFIGANQFVDADVNNLVIYPSTPATHPAKLALKYAGQGGSVPQVVANAMAKIAVIIRPTSSPDIPGRVAKLRSRGWRVQFAATAGTPIQV